MATLFRALVMLLVLIGLPAAWVYYGPLPPEAMGMIQRTVASAQQAFGLSDRPTPDSWVSPAKTAPKFDPSLAHQVTPTPRQQTPIGPTPPRSLRQDPQFSLASATLAPPPATPAPVDAELAQQLEPHLALLRSLDAAEYSLENWGGDGHLYRFRCEIVWGENEDFTRQFEAINADPLRAVHQVVGEVTSWQNTRHAPTPPRWQ